MRIRRPHPIQDLVALAGTISARQRRIFRGGWVHAPSIECRVTDPQDKIGRIPDFEDRGGAGKESLEPSELRDRNDSGAKLRLPHRRSSEHTHSVMRIRPIPNDAREKEKMISTDRVPSQAFWALAFALTCFVLFLARPVAAEDFTVNTTADSGAGSLRQGITDSNDAPDMDNTINFEGFEAGSESTFLLGAPVLEVDGTLVLNGTGSGGLDIRGDGTNLLSVDRGGQLQLNDISFSAGELSLGSSSSLTFDVTGDTITISDTITETGTNAAAVIKSGAGTLILTGENTFTGVTQINQGTLEVTTSAISMDVGTRRDTILRFSETPDQEYGGRISGAGAVEKSGAGTLTLTGTNNYEGGTTINDGKLMGTPDSIQGNIAINSGAALEITDISDRTFVGSITGAGMFVKSGTGILTLDPTSDPNSWSQGQVTDGTLQGDAAAISGNVNIFPTATLAINQTGTANLSGNLRGAGKFEKLGDGTLTLTGNNSGLTNTSADAIMVREGSLIGNTSSLPTNFQLQMGTSLMFNQSVAGTYDNTISGNGNFIKTGSGTLTLSGVQTYTGSTTISAGRLNVDGLETLNTTVASGATLGGTGSINGDVLNSGRIAPGTSIGTLQVDSISFLPGSVLEIEIDPSGATDLLDVEGQADLADAALDLRIGIGTYTNASFTIVEAQAGTEVDIPSVALDFPLLDIVLEQSESRNALVLTVDSTGEDIGDVATTPNQRAVGNALDEETPADGTDLKLVIDAFSTLQRPEFEAALDSLSGETLTQFATARFELADRFDFSLHSRLRNASDALDVSRRRRGRRRKTSMGLPGLSAASTRPVTPQIDFWSEPFAVFGGITGHQGESDVDYTVFGGALGVETHPFPSKTNELRNIRLGAAFAYGRSKLKFDDRTGSGTADSYMGALYGGWSNDRFRAALSGRLAYSDMDSKRRIVVGTLDRKAKADFNGLDLGTRVEVGGKWISNEVFVLESYGGLDYAHLQRSSIRERGATSINLRIDREKLETLRFNFGTRLVALFDLDADTWILPEIRAEWHHQFLDRDRAIDANFAGATANPGFKIRGADLPPNSASVGVGWTVRTRSGFEAAINYDLGIDTDRLANAIGLRIATYW